MVEKTPQLRKLEEFSKSIKEALGSIDKWHPMYKEVSTLDTMVSFALKIMQKDEEKARAEGKTAPHSNLEKMLPPGHTVEGILNEGIETMKKLKNLKISRSYNDQEIKEKLLKKVAKKEATLPKPPQSVVDAMRIWVKNTWQNEAEWITRDPIEKTWQLLQLIKLMQESSGRDVKIEPLKGSTEWGSYTTRKDNDNVCYIGMGAPSILWAIHEALHILADDDDEPRVWAMTKVLFKEVYKGIDDAYAERTLQQEFNTQMSASASNSEEGWSPLS